MKTTRNNVSLRTILLVLPLIYFGISAPLLYINRIQSYPYYQRIQFESAGATMYANLHHPFKKLDFQDNHPLVIYAPGSGWQKDVDNRVILELTKRGFFVAGIDYQGHGESGGDLLNFDQETGKLGIAQDCSKLVDAIENLAIYETLINPAQIGLVGHSLGGLVVLMNAVLDSRFSATISWAGVVNSSLSSSPDFAEFNPVNRMNETNPQNLLIIHAEGDGTVSYEDHAIVAQRLTGCTIINITDSFFSDHYLISDTVLIKTINWYEGVFFGSETINGPIELSWISTLTIMVFGLIGILLCALVIIIFSSKYVLGKDFLNSITSERPSEKSKRITKLLGFVSSLVIYIIRWVGMIQFFGLSAIFIAPIILICAYMIFILVKTFIIDKKPINLDGFKEALKSHLNLKAISFSLISTVVFLGLYYLFSLSYP